jgi:hypothetical protein
MDTGTECACTRAEHHDIARVAGMHHRDVLSSTIWISSSVRPYSW